MEKEVLRVITEMEQRKWITINEHLNREAIAREFVVIFKEMKLSDYIAMFTPIY